jgi:AcrR family transcriptional regulator
MASPKKAKRKPAAGRADLAARIVETAIGMAEDDGWENVRLRLVADALGVGMDDVRAHFRDLDAVANAWFGRAHGAMLAPPPKGFADLPVNERLYGLIMGWLDALAPHRRVTAEILGAKMYPFHPHHWMPMIATLSRTIQWLRDAAGLDAGGRQRQVEEIGLSVLFVATVAVWCGDETPDQERTRAYLARRLAQADRGMACLCRCRGRPSGHAYI